MKQHWLLPALTCLFLLALRPIPLAAQQTLFTKITAPDNPLANFANTSANYKGCVWIDLDHDNWPDAFVSQKFLFRNLGNGNFERLPDVNGATLGQAASGSSWGDLDNDGDLDCITASTVSGLHYNLGDQTFELRNTTLPLFANYRAWDCCLADVDNNGRLDLFFAHADNFPAGSAKQPCKFYRQSTAGTFTIDTSYEFAVQYKPYTIPIWTDFDLDGDLDLFMGSGPGGSPGEDFCYRNLLRETNTFSLQRLTSPPFDALQDGQVYNTVDFDLDGDFDICLTNYAGARTRFYKNESGNYTETSTTFTQQGQFLTNAWGDIDNDGYQDVLITRDASTGILLHRNLQGQAFEAGKIAATVPSGTNACGLALADYDNDGDLDFYVNGATTGRSLFRNDSLATQRNWVSFTLEGTASNRSAIGALVRLKANIGGQSLWQMREVLAHNSFQSQHDLRQHFGLDQATLIDSLWVRWPSGLVQQYSSLAPNNFYKIVEGQDITLLSGTESPESVASFRIWPNPLSKEFRVEAEHKISQIDMFDSTGRSHPLSLTLHGRSAQVWLLGNPPSGTYFVRTRFANGKVAIVNALKL